jgi:uncharacterized membrane protein YdbT with pleckstrin-like domain
MKCFSCGTALPEGANFCSACGTRQGLPGAPPAAPSIPEPEMPVWKGGYSARNDALAWVLWFLFATVAVYAVIRWVNLPEPWMRWMYWGAVLLPAALVLAGSLFRRFSVRYRLTSHRLFKEVGILSRRTTEIELMRVDDLSVSQNVLQRMLDVGLITLRTTDASDPEILMAGILNPHEVKEAIRAHVQKRRGRTLNMEAL